MIDRYSSKEMKEIFSLNNKFRKYLDVELALVDYLYSINKISKEEYEKIKTNASFDLDGILEIEKETKHDVIAFTRNVSSYLGEEKRWIHYGLTSTDVVDTASAKIYKEANDIIYNKLLKLKEVLKEKALMYKKTPCIGRTHGIHADITFFGLKWALYYDELNRDLKRFNEARQDIETGKISGAVGTSIYLPLEAQSFICKKLGINEANISTQVLQRDRHAYYISTIALIGGLLEKIGLEIRNLARTEVHEVSEYFSKNQKGSSAMPHKHNPIGSENICGCARILRGYMTSIYEDMALFHERDISHSSVERVSLADGITLIEYMITRMTKIISTLIIYPENMLKNISLTNNIIYSQRVLTELINKGYTREYAYDLIQPIAYEAYENNIDFFVLLKKNKELNSLFSLETIESFKNFDFYYQNVEEIYKKVGL